MSSPALLLAQSASPCFLACSPEGPSTPFGTPVLAVFDALRALCMIAGLVVIVVTPTVVLRAGHWGQAMRFAALCAFCLVAVDTRMEHFGDYPSVRLLVDLLGTAAALLGIWSFFRSEGGTTGSGATPGPARDVA